MTFEYRGGIITSFLRVIGIVLVLAGAACQRAHEPTITARSQNETRPNVLIFVADALGPELGVYEDPAARTPNIDAIAAKGVTYANAYATSGSTGAAYGSLLTGMYPQTLGIIQDWTGQRGWNVAPQPEVRAFPELLRRAGYHSFRVGPKNDPFGGSAAMWDEDEREVGVTWLNHDIPQPFLGVVEITTLPQDDKDAPKAKKKNLWENLFSKKEKPRVPVAIDASKIVVPSYLPDTPAVRAALKARYQRIANLDAQIGETMARLQRSGALTNTIVIVTARTGAPLPRGERTLYDSGVRIPLIVRYPDGRGAGTVSHALISGADLAPSILMLARQQPMAWVQGRDRLSPAASRQPASYVFSIQNRVGSVFERSRAVRDGHYLLILNSAPGTRLWDLARRGDIYDAVAGRNGAPTLGPNQTVPRPEVELYDLRTDPAQVHNLAADAGHLADVQRLAAALAAFNAQTPDMSYDTTQNLKDRFQPGGQTPVTAGPVLRLAVGRVKMEAPTPGSTIEWRLKEGDNWTLYRAPVPLPRNGRLQAKASRYGFADSDIQMFDAKKK